MKEAKNLKKLIDISLFKNCLLLKVKLMFLVSYYSIESQSTLMSRTANTNI